MTCYGDENHHDMDVDMEDDDEINEGDDNPDGDDKSSDGYGSAGSVGSGNSNPYQYGIQRISRTGTIPAVDDGRSFYGAYHHGASGRSLGSAAGSDDGGNMIDSVDMGYGDDNDLGYEPHAPHRADSGNQPFVPVERRGSMTQQQEQERRASIKAVMADTTLSPMAKRRSIQHLMDGRRNSINTLINATSSMVLSNPSDSACDNVGERGIERTNSYGGVLVNGGIGTNGSQTHNSNQQSCAPVGVPNASGGMGYFAISNEYTKYTEQNRPHCSHYVRNCTIIAACCGAAFGCRICHDDCPNLPPKINNVGRRYNRSASLPSSFISMDQEDTEHTIDRFAIAEVICRLCYTRQSSKTNKCVSCGMQFGEYHCNICNLWMSSEENPYHCKDCGFCRVGGAENFQHCHSCGMCIDITLIATHNCKAGKYRSNCPVCQEYLFSSRGASHEMPCGHAIHWECFRQLAAHDSRCPICKKTAETRDRMMPTWEAIAASIAIQPIPPELARVVSITCNDCESSEDARAWHFLGIQCSKCQSFNTVVDKILLTGDEAHEFLETNARIAAAYQQRQEQEQWQQQQRQQQVGGNYGEIQATTAGQEEPRRRRVNRRRSAF